MSLKPPIEVLVAFNSVIIPELFLINHSGRLAPAYCSVLVCLLILHKHISIPSRLEVSVALRVGVGTAEVEEVFVEGYDLASTGGGGV